MKGQMDMSKVEHILRSALSETSEARTRLQTDRWSDVNDEAQWSEAAAVAMRELDVAWAKKKQARAALDQLKTGHYGECAACGRPIGEARLVALPWATHCVRCASIRERAKAQTLQPAGSPGEWLDDAPDAA